MAVCLSSHIYLKQLLLGTSRPSALPVILCIGTDRLIGDSLGPMVGTMLTRLCKNLPDSQRPFIYGTLHSTVHALNLTETNIQIKKRHPDCPVIAVDASLGSYDHIGSVTIRPGSLYPGAGVHKTLPPTGDIAITGITNSESTHPFLDLQTAHLSVVADMADHIASCILSACTQ